MPGARTTLALGLALILAGAAFDAASLYVPGFALTLLAGGSLAWVESTARAVSLERARGPASVLEGEPYLVRIAIRKGSLPLVGELRDPLLERPRAVRAPPGEREQSLRIEVSFPRRGRRRLEPASLLIRDPLGLRARELRSTGGGEIVVLPRIEPVIAAGNGRGGIAGRRLDGADDGGGSGTLDLRPLDVEVDGLRPYRQGSPASRIYWPALARSGELLERRLISGTDSSPLVVLDSTRPASEGALDAAVRAAASLCRHLARASGCQLLLPGDARPLAIDEGLRNWPLAHARLAVAEADRAVAAPPARGAGSGAAFWVQARAGGPPRQALARLGGSSLYLVGPLPLAGAPTLFTVAGCVGQRLRAASAARRAASRSAA